MRIAFVRCFASLLALVIPAASLASVHHQATEVHVLCAEHGHLVHMDSSELPGLSANENGHEGCAFEQASSKLRLENASRSDLQMRTVSAFDPRPQQAQLVLTRDLLVDAPKTSPPSA